MCCLLTSTINEEIIFYYAATLAPEDGPEPTRIPATYLDFKAIDP